MSPADSSPTWTAVAVAALDVRGTGLAAIGAEIAALPRSPGEMVLLTGAGTDLWRRLVIEGPLPDDHLDAGEAGIVRGMLVRGLASTDADDPARVRTLPVPTLSSPLHEVVYALVGHVAAGLGIRAVFVKGPALRLQGLREREHSGDVDVWCEPGRWDELADALTVWGWHREPTPWRGTAAHHTVTLLPDSWGCEIDLHRRMPGLTLSDAAAFDLVHQDATPLRFAGVDVLVPAVDTHAVLAAVHAVRPEIGIAAREGFHPGAADLLARVPGTVTRSRELGAVPVLRRELATLVPDADLADDDHGVPRDWQWRMASTRARAYWTALRSEPAGTRLALLARVLWPDDEVALASARRAGEETTDPRRARRRRLRRAAREWFAARRRGTA